MFHKTILLDTCALLWLAEGNRRIPESTLQVIEKASLVFVSAITAWEIGLKAERKQLLLPCEAAEWFQAVIDHHHIMVAPLAIDILMESNQLPWHHRDPADRFIIATAMKEKAAIVTADEKFEKYDVTLLAC